MSITKKVLTRVFFSLAVSGIAVVVVFLYTEMIGKDSNTTRTFISHGLQPLGMFGDLAAHSSEAEGNEVSVFRPDSVEEFKRNNDWCRPHHVPESMCTVCNPELIEKFKEKGDWCAAHGVPESLCAVCNQSLAAAGLGLSPAPPQDQEISGEITAETISRFREKGDWCSEHNVPESMCVKCRPKLAETFRSKGDWCEEHRVPESLCVDCNPSLADLGIGKDWCAKHGLPESQCMFCHPELVLTTGATKTAGVSDRNPNLWFKLKPLDKPMDNPDKRLAINPNCRLHATQILLSSPELTTEIGIRVQEARSETVSETLSCYGEVAYNQHRFVLLSSRSPGIVRAVKVDLGDSVQRDQVVAIVDSVDLGKAKAEYLRALTDYHRWKWLNDSYQSSNGSNAFSRKERLEAEASLEKASIEVEIAAQALKNLGLEDEMLRHVRDERDTSTFLPISAPFSGTVVALNSVIGEVVDRGEAILTLADTSSMWLMLDVFVKDLSKIKKGQAVDFRPDGLEGEVFHGQIDWISTSLDEKTRTAKVRAVLKNPDRRIQARLFGTGLITLHKDDQVVTVPREAVQWDGCCNIVFVQITDQLYQPRKVRIGYATDNVYVIDAGLLPGEKVVTTGSYLFKTEILKGSIGAGCTCGV